MQDSYIIIIKKMKSTNIQFYQTKYAKFGPTSQSTTKHCMFKAKNLHQSRKIYISAADDA